MLNGREIWKPGTMAYPVPAVLVSCGNRDSSNLITVAWTGTVCTDPAMLYISVRPERHSYNMIKENMEFTVNLTTEAMAKAVDWCGVRSGRDYDKWQHTKLTPQPGHKVACPYVKGIPPQHRVPRQRNNETRQSRHDLSAKCLTCLPIRTN